MEYGIPTPGGGSFKASLKGEKKVTAKTLSNKNGGRVGTLKTGTDV